MPIERATNKLDPYFLADHDVDSTSKCRFALFNTTLNRMMQLVCQGLKLAAVRVAAIRDEHERGSEHPIARLVTIQPAGRMHLMDIFRLLHDVNTVAVGELLFKKLLMLRFESMGEWSTPGVVFSQHDQISDSAAKHFLACNMLKVV